MERSEGSEETGCSPGLSDDDDEHVILRMADISCSEEEPAPAAFNIQEEIEHLQVLAMTPTTLKINRFFQEVVSGPWLDGIAVMFIIMNCGAETTYTPCETELRSMKLTEMFVHAFFLTDMMMKIFYLGFYGTEGSYLRSNWNKFEFLIFWAESLDVLLRTFGLTLGISQTLKPVRLISRVKSLRILVSLLFEILPAVARCLVLLTLVIYTFGLLGVQLWNGELVNRCSLGVNVSELYNISMSPYYLPTPADREPFICSARGFGMRHCHQVPPLRDGEGICSSAPSVIPDWTVPTAARSNLSRCVNWNLLYNTCLPLGPNPGMGVTNFDHIGYAWITIFQVLSLEGWADIMYSVMDASSFWSLLYFLFVTVVGSFIVMRTCTIFIAAKFSASQNRYRSEHRPTTGALRNLFNTWISQLRRNQDGSKDSDSSRIEGSDRMFWTEPRYRRKLKDLVAGQHFSYVMNCIIIFSLVTMTVEHHNQPEIFTQVLHVCNIIFTTIFLTEMVLKVVANLCGYFLDCNNILGFIIIVTSLIELSSGALRRLSVFRALRFLHLVTLLPRLTEQVLVLKRAMRESCPLFMLFFIVIFLFSTVGMQVFACELNFSTQYINASDDRKNFDVLLWSMVTVFQILTKEDWNYMMYNAVVSTNPWAALFFVALIVVGSIVLLSVLVGIVIDSIQAQRTAADELLSSPSGAEDGPDSSPADPNPNQQDAAELTETTQDWWKEHKDWSLYILSPQNRFRRFCQILIKLRVFKAFMAFINLLSCFIIIFERPGMHPNSVERWLLNMGYIFTTVIFTMETLLKVVSLGLIIGERSYGRSPLNWVDGVVTITSLVDVILVQLTGGARTPRIARFLRLLRVFKSLKLVKQTASLRLAFQALVTSGYLLVNVLLVCCFIFYFYGLVGMQLFMGMFHQCVGETLTNITNRSGCLTAGYQWVQGGYNFDSFPQAMIALFVAFSKDGWTYIMYHGLDAVGVDQQPVKNKSLWALFYFISFEILSFFLEDMFIGVVIENFYRRVLQQKMTGRASRREESREQTNAQFYRSLSSGRRRIYNLCNTLDRCFPILIFINMVMMGFEHYKQSENISKMLEYSFDVFTILLMIEVLLKIFAFGIRRFFRDGWNLLDVAILLASFVSVFLSQLQKPDLIPFNLSLLRVCRILRLHQMLKAGTIRTLLRSIWTTLLQIGSLLLLFLLIFYIYAPFGVELFGRLECTVENPCQGLSRYSDFRHFGMAMLTLFKVCTGDNWSGVLQDTLRTCRPEDSSCLMNWVTSIYFLTFVIIAQLILLNVIAAVIMQTLLDSKEIKKKLGMNDEEVDHIELVTRPQEPQSSSLPDVQVSPTP